MTWSQALDDYEARLLAQRDALAAGTPDAVPPFVPPTDLGPLPSELVDRAESLVADSRGLIDEMDAARSDLATRLATSRRAPRPLGTGAYHARPSHFDSRL